MELHKAYDRYEYQDVCERIDLLRMKLGEYLEDLFIDFFTFSINFLRD